MKERGDKGGKGNNEQHDAQSVENGKGDEAGGSRLSPEQRREALRRILAGGGIVIGADVLPDKWSNPVVDSVILPAHAATSLADPCSLSVTPVSGGYQVVVSGFVSPPSGGVDLQILVELLSGNTVVDSDTTSATTAANGQYTSPLVTLTGIGTSVRATSSIDGIDQTMCQQPIAAPTTTSTTTTSTTSTTFTSTTTSSLG